MVFDDILSICEDPKMVGKPFCIYDKKIVNKLSELEKRILYIVLLELDINDKSVSKEVEMSTIEELDDVIKKYITVREVDNNVV